VLILRGRFARHHFFGSYNCALKQCHGVVGCIVVLQPVRRVDVVQVVGFFHAREKTQYGKGSDLVIVVILQTQTLL
jgi:hypothetical protein